MHKNVMLENSGIPRAGVSTTLIGFISAHHEDGDSMEGAMEHVRDSYAKPRKEFPPARTVVGCGTCSAW